LKQPAPKLTTTLESTFDGTCSFAKRSVSPLQVRQDQSLRVIQILMMELKADNCNDFAVKVKDLVEQVKRHQKDKRLI
jgi:hypothetical protein